MLLGERMTLGMFDVVVRVLMSAAREVFGKLRRRIWHLLRLDRAATEWDHILLGGRQFVDINGGVERILSVWLSRAVDEILIGCKLGAHMCYAPRAASEKVSFATTCRWKGWRTQSG